MLNAIVSAVASLQVADALKLLSGHPEKVRARIATIDVWEGTLRQIDAPERDPDCPCCARREFTFLEERDLPPVSLCGRNAVQIEGARGRSICANSARGSSRWAKCAPTSLLCGLPPMVMR